MTEEKNLPKKPHNIIMSNCEKMSLTGVRDVESFDEHLVVCFTDCGELVIRGNMLHVDHMNVETGDMELAGSITSLTYTGEKKRGGFFSRLLR